MEKKIDVTAFIDENRAVFSSLSDKIWDFAEPRYQEFQSAAVLKEELKKHGFSIESSKSGIETAFIASYGEGEPVVAFLGEYDALYQMSQNAGIAYKKEMKEGSLCGHGCGHHALGVGSLAGAVATAKYLAEEGRMGTVRFYGCPAEEGGSGKTFMARAGDFEGVDAALTWHPSSRTGVFNFSTLANIQTQYKFRGKSAHAAMAPHLGRSALDAVELMNIGSNFLREHIIPEARLHYAVTNAGGLSPNVVQAQAEALYLIRAPKISQVQEIQLRLDDIAKGATLMTGTDVEAVFDRATSHVVPNFVLARILHEKISGFGKREYSEEEQNFAEEIQKSFVSEPADQLFVRKEIEKCERMKPCPLPDFEKPLSERIEQYSEAPLIIPASTDVGDISCVVPTAQIFTACYALGTPEHSWQLVSQGKQSYFHSGMLTAGKTLALAAIELFQKPELLALAKAEFQQRMKDDPYCCPIPKNVMPSKYV